MKRTILIIALISSFVCINAQQWPVPRHEAKPYTRWWWLGSAVTEEGLRYNLSEYKKAGIGGVEITPIYGVQGNEKNEIQYLSPQWMKMLQTTETIGKELGIDVDMATGTGWPFGGPDVPLDEAACKLNDDFTIGRTKQKVKRAAPGGEGYVIDHFDHDAVRHYLEHFDQAFDGTDTPYPHTFFNDSYEVYNADWTPRFLDEFKARRGYDLLQYKEDFLNEKSPIHQLLISDYRETLGELLLDNFTTQWTGWAHSHGAITRNQAHGSPANLIDIYAAVDIPECEGFGLSDFGIRGLRTDPGFTKKNDSDLSMLKYASSAAHITGKQFTSSETFTWLTEHFRTSLSQCKPDFDLMMVAGVNHIFFHGSTYSPKGDQWPGWRFYASVDMTPANNWWDAMPAFSKYVERVQSFMQYGEPDNDVLVYLPYYDMIHDLPGRLVQFDIHHMAERAPKFIRQVTDIIHAGYDCDYISDKYIVSPDPTGFLGKPIVIPDVRYMPLETLQKLYELSRKGTKVLFIGSMPDSVPGYGRIKGEQKAFERLLRKFRKTAVVADDASQIKSLFGIEPESMRTNQGLSLIRRSNTEGHHYFISNLQSRDVDEWVTLGKPYRTAVFYNPMNGDITLAKTDGDGQEGRLHLQLKSGESIILRTYTDAIDTDRLPHHKYRSSKYSQVIPLKDWTLTFPKAAPEAIADTFHLDTLRSWTELGSQALQETMATGRYETTFTFGSLIEGGRGACVVLSLGDIRETARVTVNGHYAGTLFAVPYEIDVTPYIINGTNTLTIEVANLPANRIARMDRDGIVWRKMKEINVVDLNYKTTNYADWSPVASGLCSEVRLLVTEQAEE